MIFGFGKARCAKCGDSVEKDKVINDNGEKFCSKDHANEYNKALAEQSNKKSGGCCGG